MTPGWLRTTFNVRVNISLCYLHRYGLSHKFLLVLVLQSCPVYSKRQQLKHYSSGPTDSLVSSRLSSLILRSCQKKKELVASRSCRCWKKKWLSSRNSWMESMQPSQRVWPAPAWQLPLKRPKMWMTFSPRNEGPRRAINSIHPQGRVMRMLVASSCKMSGK